MIFVVLAKPQSSLGKVSCKSFKRAIGSRRPLFGGSQLPPRCAGAGSVKAGRRNLVALIEIVFSSERGPAHSAFIQDVLEAALQVHAAFSQKRLTRLALNGTGGAMKSFS